MDLILSWEQRSAPGDAALPLPDKPSIAVLPFDNLSADPEEEYFVDGLTDDLITDLSKVSGLFVIARNSVVHLQGPGRGHPRGRRDNSGVCGTVPGR